MRKLLLTIVLLLVAVVIGGGIYVFLVSRSTQPASVQNETGTSPFGSGAGAIPSGGSGQGNTTSSQTSEQFIVLGADGSMISVADFRSEPGVQELSDGSYRLGPFTGSSTYQILYYAADKSFTVTLLEEPLGATRESAEQYLMNALQIGKPQMCRLRYGVYVPIKISQFYAATNLGFSFCPRAIKLP